jgi:macrodomain Ter protein organizer (MatP/YcbG family)
MPEKTKRKSVDIPMTAYNRLAKMSAKERHKIKNYLEKILIAHSKKKA